MKWIKFNDEIPQVLTAVLVIYYDGAEELMSVGVWDGIGWYYSNNMDNDIRDVSAYDNSWVRVTWPKYWCEIKGIKELEK